MLIILISINKGVGVLEELVYVNIRNLCLADVYRGDVICLTVEIFVVVIGVSLPRINVSVHA